MKLLRIDSHYENPWYEPHEYIYFSITQEEYHTVALYRAAREIPTMFDLAPIYDDYNGAHNLIKYGIKGEACLIGSRGDICNHYILNGQLYE